MLKKFSQPLTARHLGAALEAAHGLNLYRDGATMHALSALFDCLFADDASEDAPARVADGELPVTASKVDQALEELRESGLSRAHIAVLKRGRDMLAAAEAERTAAQAAAGGRPATRADLDACIAAMAVALAAVELAARHPGRADASISWQLAHAVTPGMSASTRAAVGQLASAFERAIDGRREAEEAQPRSGKVWQPGYVPY